MPVQRSVYVTTEIRTVVRDATGKLLAEVSTTGEHSGWDSNLTALADEATSTACDRHRPMIAAYRQES